MMFAFVKKIKGVLIPIALLIFGILTGVMSADIQAQAAQEDPGIFAYIPFGDGRSVNIAPVNISGRFYLFLPSGMSAKGVVFHYDASAVEMRFKDGSVLEPDKVINITPYLSDDTGDGSRLLNLSVVKPQETTPLDLYVMQSANIPSIYISSDDPAHGRGYVDEAKSNTGSGTMTMLTSSGTVVYDGGLTQIKARGNTTFKADKKAYQIKLSDSVDLTQSGAGASKTWILLANAYDPTLIHNTTAYRMAQSFGINSPDCKAVDLYYDGVYRGNYLLSEKVQIGEGRVNIDKLESRNEDANTDKDLDKLATATGANKYGDIYRYVTGMNTPEKYDGGYLLELDNAYYKSERSYFITSTGVAFVVKSPENCSKEEMIFISEYVEELVSASVNGGVCPYNEKSVWDYIDLKSLSRFFVLQETVSNADSFASSTYFYLNSDGSSMMAGPVWDFDDSYGIREDHSSTEGFVGGGFIEPFMNLPDFRREVKNFVATGTYSKASKGQTDTYVSEIAASQKMNRVLWNNSEQMFSKLGSYDEDIAYMKNYSAGRLKWLRGVFATW